MTKSAIEEGKNKNVLTESGESLRCRSQVLGQEFDFEISIAANGQLFLSVEGEKDLDNILEIISQRCATPVESILPLLLTNLALLCRKELPKPTQARSPRQATFLVDSPTIH